MPPWPRFQPPPRQTVREVLPHTAFRQPSPWSFQGLVPHIPRAEKYSSPLVLSCAWSCAGGGSPLPVCSYPLHHTLPRIAVQVLKLLGRVAHTKRVAPPPDDRVEFCYYCRQRLLQASSFRLLPNIAPSSLPSRPPRGRRPRAPLMALPSPRRRCLSRPRSTALCLAASRAGGAARAVGTAWPPAGGTGGALPRGRRKKCFKLPIRCSCQDDTRLCPLYL